MMLMLNVPATFGLMCLAGPIVELLVEYRNVTAQNTAGMAAALMGYAPGLVGYSAVKIASPTFYALKDSRTPVTIGMVCIVLNVVLNLVLVRTSLSYAGLALGTGIAALANALLLFWMLRRRLGGLDERPRDHRRWSRCCWRRARWPRSPGASSTSWPCSGPATSRGAGPSASASPSAWVWARWRSPPGCCGCTNSRSLSAASGAASPAAWRGGVAPPVMVTMPPVRGSSVAYTIGPGRADAGRQGPARRDHRDLHRPVHARLRRGARRYGDADFAADRVVRPDARRGA